MEAMEDPRARPDLTVNCIFGRAEQAASATMAAL
jgi:hypothetical protein